MILFHQYFRFLPKETPYMWLEAVPEAKTDPSNLLYQERACVQIWQATARAPVCGFSPSYEMTAPQKLTPYNQ